MKFFFIDETERQKQGSGNYQFLLCGLIVDSDQLIGLNNEIEGIKSKYLIQNLKDSRKSGWDVQKRLDFTQELYSAISRNKATARASILGEVALGDMHAVSGNYLAAFAFLLERFFIALEQEYETAIIIFDSMSKSLEGELRKKLFALISSKRIVMHGVEREFYKKRIFPAILFSDDKYNNILQASDLIANCLNSALWSCRRSGLSFDIEKLDVQNPFLKIYWPLLVKSSSGKVSGWGIKIWW